MRFALTALLWLCATVALAIAVPTVWAVVVAGGSGQRFGQLKQFALLATRLPRDEFDVHAVTLTRGGPYEAMLQGAGVVNGLPFSTT